MNRYKKLKFVGEGSFARVYKVVDKKTQQIMALKCIKKSGKSGVEIDKLMEEIMILQSLSHKNIIKIMEWFVTESDICVVTEFADNGELFKMIKKKKSNRISEMDIKQIAKQLVSALQFLHDSRVIHRDIKPQNILLSKDDTVKLCDFGFARALSEESTMATSIKGTPLYMAPELVQEKPYNHSVDLWSLGVILYELHYGKPPFYTNSIYKLVRMIVKDHIKYPANPPISKEFQHFISGLLQKNPQKRFDIQHLHKHIFLQTAQRNIHKLHAMTPKPTKRKDIITLKKASYSDTYLKQIRYQKKTKSTPYLHLKANPYKPTISAPATPQIKDTKPKSCEYFETKSSSYEKENKWIQHEQKEEEIMNAEHVKSTNTNASSPCYHSSSSESNASIASLSKNNNKKQKARNAVRQKVLDILDSNDWKMIDKILVVLPQRWQSLCSSTDGQHLLFEMKLFNKLYSLLSNTQNASVLSNIIQVMCLTIDRIQNTQQIASISNAIRNILHYTQKYMNNKELFPILCKFMKSAAYLKDAALINMMRSNVFISSLISSIIQYEFESCKVIQNVIDIICAIVEYHPMDFHVANTETLKLKAFSKSSMSKIAFYTFWSNICDNKYCNKIDFFFSKILQQKSENTLKFILYLLMTSKSTRHHVNNTSSIKQSLICYACTHFLQTDSIKKQFDALLLFYSLNGSEITPQILHPLQTLSNSSNIFISNLSHALLIRNHLYLSCDPKSNLQNIVKFIHTQQDLDRVVFDTNCNQIEGKNIFDYWCNCLCNLQINDNIKLSITVALQWFNILSKRIQEIVNKPNKDNKTYIISAHSLKIFLTFLYQILQLLMSENASNNILNINAQQKAQLIREFLSTKHIQTLSILGNPQFVLEYMSIVPFYVDTLYTDLIQCCNMSYCCILYIYRYLASEYSRHASRAAISPSPAFHRHHSHILGDTKQQNTKHKQGVDDKWIYNFHKITLEFQLISSILNYIQISPPKQKEEACNLLFYITWKQSLFMKEFLNNSGLLIVTNYIIKQRKYHSNSIIIQVLQIISCTARKHKNFYNKIEKTGIFKLIPKFLLNDNESLEVKEKICNLIGNLCKHSDNFLHVIREEELLKILCKCTENQLSPNIRRFACYAIGNIAYQSTKNNNNIDHLIICIKHLSLRLCDKDYKTQENAAGAIGNLVSQNQQNYDNMIIINEIIKHKVIQLLLEEIRSNAHLCVVRNCLYSLSNVCSFDKCKKSMRKFGWRHVLKSCLDKYGSKDPFVKKCAFKILRKMESTVNIF